jgi:hypothetical protein
MDHTGINIDASVYYKPHVALKFFEGDAGPVVRYTGTELEIHNFKHPFLPGQDGLKAVVKKWHGAIVKDWGNMEIQLSPAIGLMYEQEITEVCDAMKAFIPLFMNGAGGTGHSGLHIHIDARDLTPRQLGRVMVVYSRLEPWFLKTQPWSRFKGKFCKALGPDASVGWLTAKSDTVAELLQYKAYQIVNGIPKGRYKAINFASYFKHKTIEVRMHEGTADPDDIIPWASMWTNFVQNTIDIPVRDGKEHPTTLTSLLELVGKEGGVYLKKRIAKYADQWTPEAMAAVMPKPVVKGKCQFCDAQTQFHCCGVLVCRKHWYQHRSASHSGDE